MAVIGTAGHVDHGKSTLIEALTGRDPDRWEEEKARGLTIDLGFSWFESEAASTLAFVDVPGHERFIKNMLAGIEAIDAAMLVVAADEGWMPQTEEHLAVLDLLGIDRGVVVLAKADLVDDELLELAQLEVLEQLEGTRLADIPIIAVSAKTGTGLGELRSELERLAVDIDSRREASARPRMWVDRSFSISGAGTVVTGTLTEGGIHSGDDLVLYPGGIEARVRGLHRHESEVGEVTAGSRCAINLSGLDRHQVRRGMMLGKEGQWRNSDRWLVRLNAARYEDGIPTGRGAYHVHYGTGAWPAELRPIEGEAGYAVLHLAEAVPSSVGDRFILREVGKRSVVAGGRIVDPSPARRRTRIAASVSLLAGIEEAQPDTRAEMLLAVRGTATVEDLAAWSGGGAVEGAHGSVAVSAAARAQLGRAAALAVSTFHETHPLRPGIPRAQLAQELGIEKSLVDELLPSWDLADGGATVALSSFATAAAQVDDEWARIASELKSAGLAVPRIRDLDVDAEVLHVFLRDERLVRINSDFVYLASQLDEIRAAVRRLRDDFTVAEFRDALQLSRKYAVPLLEYLDSTGFTIRGGDTRSVRA